MAELPTPRTPDAEPVTAPDQTVLPSEGIAVGYEIRDIRLKPIFYATLALVVSALAVQLSMWLLFDMFQAREIERGASDRPLAAELRRALPPEPRLQYAPLDDLAALRAWEERLLTTYAVLDRKSGIVRIPIERAIELMAERGLPVRKTPPPPAARRPQADAPLAQPGADDVAPSAPGAKPGADEQPAAKVQPSRPAGKGTPAEAEGAAETERAAEAERAIKDAWPTEDLPSPGSNAQPSAPGQPAGEAPAAREGAR